MAIGNPWYPFLLVVMKVCQLSARPQIVLSKGTVSIGELFEQKEVFEEVTEMEADDINWDTIVEVLPSGSGEEYEERIK